MRAITLAFGAGVTYMTMCDAFFGKTMERNLFPIEFLWWIALFTPAIAIGAVLALLLRRRQ